MSDEVKFPRPPFSPYDFFGILIPGACLCVCSYLFEMAFAGSRPTNGYHDLIFHWLLAETRPTGQPVVEASFVIVCIVFVYVVGHVVASVSSLFIDRLFVYKGYGYPYEFLLLKTPSKAPTRRRMSRNLSRGAVFWFNVCLAVAIVLKAYFNKLDLFTSVMPVVLLVVGPFCFKWGIEMFHNNENPQRQPSDSLDASDFGERLRLFGSRVQMQWQKCRRHVDLLLKYYVCFYDMPARLVESCIRTREPLQKEVKEKYLMYYQKHFDLDPKNAGSTNYWFTKFYVAQNNRELHALIERWYQVSSFARNMATAFYLAYCYGAIAVFLKTGKLDIADANKIIIALCIFLGMSVVMFVRYYYFYVAYYSKGLFRAFVYLSELANQRKGT